ncbi:MAG: 30S ribosomal protein S18 [Anaerolineales bacterium]|nr:30S ribosomal protein S18 [Anaerolineales bacterium]
MSSEGSRRTGGPPGRRRYSRRPRVCQFCAEKATSIDYKQADMLKRYVTDQGKIRSRRETGTCAKHQRMMSKAVKRARHMALLPFAAERFR